MARVPLHVLFLPHFDVIHDLFLNRSKARWILFVNEISGLKTGNIKIHLVVPGSPLLTWKSGGGESQKTQFMHR